MLFRLEPGLLIFVLLRLETFLPPSADQHQPNGEQPHGEQPQGDGQD